MSANTTSRHQEWLEALEPRVRAEVEAEIAYYKPDGVWEFEEVDIDEDWVPPAGSGMGLTVEFSGEEIHTLTKAFGTSVEMFEIMHDALMERARAVLAERDKSESESVAAAD